MNVALLILGLLHAAVCALGLIKVYKKLGENPLFYGYIIIFVLGLFIFIVGAADSGIQYINLVSLITWWFSTFVWYAFFILRRPNLKYRVGEYFVASFVCGIIASSSSGTVSLIFSLIMAAYLIFIGILVITKPEDEFQNQRGSIIVDIPPYMKIVNKPSSEEEAIGPSLVAQKTDKAILYLRWSCVFVFINAGLTFLSLIGLINALHVGFLFDIIWVFQITTWVLVLHCTLLLHELEGTSPKFVK